MTRKEDAGEPMPEAFVKALSSERLGFTGRAFARAAWAGISGRFFRAGRDSAIAATLDAAEQKRNDECKAADQTALAEFERLRAEADQRVKELEAEVVTLRALNEALCKVYDRAEDLQSRLAACEKVVEAERFYLDDFLGMSAKLPGSDRQMWTGHRVALERVKESLDALSNRGGAAARDAHQDGDPFADEKGCTCGGTDIGVGVMHEPGCSIHVAARGEGE